jgi:hypothetical protein
MIRRAAMLLAAMGLFAAAPVNARVLNFHANLDGSGAASPTDSKATGHAVIHVDTDAETVDMTLDVHGVKTTDLWDKLVHRPIGPVHLHIYGGHDHGAGATSALAFPFPYGSDYAATADGFQIVAKGSPYGVSAATVNSTVPFADFVKSLEAGDIVLNIHTNAYNDGEIGGAVIADGAA